MTHTVPVILFTYNRSEHLRKTLESLKVNKVPLLYIFSDAAKNEEDEESVRNVRSIIRGINWCRTIITERERNYGLGRSILTGVSEVLEHEEMIIVLEDDLICAPGMYTYLSLALEHYQDDEQVMSVAGWNHERVTPSNIIDEPYFDGRTESWVWGTWARVWPEMVDNDAIALIKRCESEGIQITRYGNDIREMAEIESTKNIWWVRFMLLHILHNGLCLRPPWSMVEHIGYDGTNVKDNDIWTAKPLRPCPPIPVKWPIPVEHPECPGLWQRCYGNRTSRAIWRVVFTIKGINQFWKDRLSDMKRDGKRK